MVCLDVFLHDSRFSKHVVTLLPSILILPMVCLNVCLHGCTFSKHVVTFLARIADIESDTDVMT